jgi:hypothetical protein
MTRKPTFLSPGHFNELPLEPPFVFHGMTTSALPLRANIRTLQRLLDRYVNFVPPQVGRFRASLPYVFLMVVDYGKLALEATNLGWFSQTEIVFAVPASHYTLCKNRWVYQGTAWFSPFIFVDSDTSLTLGRRVYGWAKLRQKLEHGASRWLADPGGSQNLVTIETAVFEELYAGREQRMQVFCEVVHVPDRSAEFPPTTSGAWLPWSVGKNAADLVMGMGRDLLETSSAMRGMPASPEVFFASAMDAFNFLNPANPDTCFATYNLKQFRDSGRPELFCHQALTRMRMRVTSLNRVAPLSDMRGLADVSGGFRVRLHRWPTLPIVDTLGLVPDREWQGDGAQVVELKPVSPFWYNADMLYERGQNLAERSHDGVWRTPHGRYHHPSRVHAREAKQSRSRGPRLDVADALFNTTLGASAQTVAGPFDALDSNIQVFPLLADQRKLQHFLDEYLNVALAPLELRFEPWAPVRTPSGKSQTEPAPDEARCAYVYLTILDWGPVRSGTDDVGDWKGEEMCIFIPIRWYKLGVLMGAGLVPAVSFASSTAGMIANSEILGWPTRKATFRRPEETWIDDPSEVQRSLLCVETEILPTLAQGQPIESRQILEISRAERIEASAREQWAHALQLELARKQGTNIGLNARERQMKDAATLLQARTLALDFLVNEAPVSVYSIKQFRDVQAPQQACYQSLTRVRHSFRHVRRVERLPEAVVLTITEYESNPIVDLFGLEATLQRTEENYHKYWIKPLHPFWMEVSLREELGECLYYRDILAAKKGGWRPGPDSKNLGNYFSKENVEWHRLDTLLARQIDNGAPLTREPLRLPSPADCRTGLAFLALVDLPAPSSTSWPNTAWPTIREAHICVVLDVLEKQLSAALPIGGMTAVAEMHEKAEPWGYLTREALEELVHEARAEVGHDWHEIYDRVANCPGNFDTIINDVVDMVYAGGERQHAKQAITICLANHQRSVPEFRRAVVARRTVVDWARRAVRAGGVAPSRTGTKEVVVHALQQILQLDQPSAATSNLSQNPAPDPQLLPLGTWKLSPSKRAANYAATLSILGMSIDDVLSRRLTHACARDVVANIDLQMILESILAREWGSLSPVSPRRAFRKALGERHNRERKGQVDREAYDVQFLQTELGRGTEQLQAHQGFFGAIDDFYKAVAGMSSDPDDTAEFMTKLQTIYSSAFIEPVTDQSDDDAIAISIGGDRWIDEISSTPGVAKVLGHIIDAVVALMRVSASITDVGDELQGLLDQAKAPGGGIFELFGSTRAAFEAEVERVFEVIAAQHCKQDFFVPECLAQHEPGASP